MQILKKRRREWQVGTDKILTPEEQTLIVTHLKREEGSVGGNRNLLIYDVMINSGVRCAELCHLRLKDTPVILGKPCLQIFRGKGNKDRNIPIPQRLAEKINEYVTTTRRRTLPRYIRRSDIEQPLFFSQLKRPYKREAIWAKFSRLGKKIGLLKPLHPHMTRHTYAKDALDRGVPLQKLKIFMGHHSILTTDVYSNVCDASLVNIANEIDHII